MSRMSEVHQDLESIHNILLGQRQVAINALRRFNALKEGPSINDLRTKIQVIDDLLLEFEFAGVVWPGNVVSLEEHITRHVGPPKDTVTRPPVTYFLNEYCGKCDSIPCGRPTGHPEDGA